MIPLIHIKDLANIIVSISDNKPKTKYILAINDSVNTLEDIVKVSNTITA